MFYLIVVNLEKAKYIINSDSEKSYQKVEKEIELNNVKVISSIHHENVNGRPFYYFLK